MVDLNKEKEPIGGSERVSVPPEVPTVESPRSAETNAAGRNDEVESWITKIEKRFGRIPQGQPGAQDDQVIVQQPQSHQPPVKLPVTQQQIQTGSKLKAELSLAWLVVWAKRQIQLLTGRGREVELAEIPEVKEEKDART